MLDSEQKLIDLRVQAEIEAIQESHKDVLLALKAMESTLSPEQVAVFAEVRETVLTAYHDQRLMAIYLEELADYAKRLIAQRQSSRQTFIAGRDAVLADLLALVTGPEYVQLRRILEDFIANDQIF